MRPYRAYPRNGFRYDSLNRASFPQAQPAYRTGRRVRNLFLVNALLRLNQNFVDRLRTDYYNKDSISPAPLLSKRNSGDFSFWSADGIS